MDTEKGFCIHKKQAMTNNFSLRSFLFSSFYISCSEETKDTSIIRCQFFGDSNSITIDILVTGLCGWQRSVVAI